MKKKAAPKANPYKLSRRPGQQAQERILDAAEALLLQGGPEAIRVADVAAAAGLTHPTLLHHFGSREGLMSALTRRASERLQHGVNRIFAETPPVPGRAARTIAALDAGAREIDEHGLAQSLAWLVLSKRMEAPGDDEAPIFQPLVDTVHAARSEARTARGAVEPTLEESRYGVALVLLQLFGDALFGPVVRRGVGLADTPEVSAAFRRGLAMILEGSGPSA